MGKSEANEDIGNENQDLGTIIREGSRFRPTKGSGIVINLFIVLINDEKRWDGEHHEKEGEVIVYKIEAQLGIDVVQQLAIKKN